MAAPSAFDRPINGESFAAYVREIPVPALVPGEIVVLDKLGSHKALAKLKAHLHKAAARFVHEVWDAIARLLDQFSPSEFTNSSRYTGYGFSCVAVV